MSINHLSVGTHVLFCAETTRVDNVYHATFCPGTIDAISIINGKTVYDVRYDNYPDVYVEVTENDFIVSGITNNVCVVGRSVAECFAKVENANQHRGLVRRLDVARTKYRQYMALALDALKEYRETRDNYWLENAGIFRAEALEWYARYERTCRKMEVI